LRSRIIVAAVVLFAFAVPSHAYRMSAWVPSWDARSLEIMRTQAGNLHETNPGWYTVAADGSVTKNYKAEDSSMRAALSGTLLVPTIKNYIGGKFDGSVVANIVNNPELREKHAEALAQLAVDKNLDGIDVDYESLPASARQNFTAFLAILADKLHATRRVLSVTVHAKTSDSTRSGPGAQDWKAIGAIADSVKIMAYDKHWSTSEAGPIAPLDWLDDVATYAESTIPKGKAIIGLPWYGYDWEAKNGSSVTFESATAKALTAGAAVSHDANGEATFSYGGRTVYFQDAASYRAKVDLIAKQHRGIAGFAHWRVGAEDPAIWAIVRELKQQGSTNDSTPARPASQSFTVEGPQQLQLVAGHSATGEFRYAGINGFNSVVTVSVESLDAFAGTASLSSPTINRTSATTLVVSVPPGTLAGTYRLNLKMTGAGLTREKVVSLTVTEPPQEFAIDGPSRLTIMAGKSAAADFRYDGINGFNSVVTVSVTPLDAFAGTAMLSSATINRTAAATLTVTVPATTPAGTYRLAVTMTGGGITHDKVLTVEVTKPKPSKRRAV
jgi:spore germination protein